VARREVDGEVVFEQVRDLRLAAAPVGDRAAYAVGMARRRSVIVAGLILACALGACSGENGSKFSGSGTLTAIRVEGSAVNKFRVSPDERYVIAEVAQAEVQVLDAGLRVAGWSSDAYMERFVFAPDGATAIGVGTSLTVRSLPRLRRRERLDESIQAAWAILALPDGAGYLAVTWREIRKFHTGPLRLGDAGKAEIPSPVAGALDDATGMLVLIGDVRWFEVFDPVAMRSVAKIRLPYAVAFDVAAAGGTAWISTRLGRILPVDIATRKVGELVPVSSEGEVSLGMSASRRTLVAAADRRPGPERCATDLKAYRVEGARLVEFAAASFESARPTDGVAVWESTGTALLSGSDPRAWHYAAATDDG
jgi:hypothetical protein